MLPIYKQIAIRFAELHDTSFRMAAKGVIEKVVKWEESRFFFYKRLNRRVAELILIRTIRDAAGETLTHKSALCLIKEWFLSSVVKDCGEDAWKDDVAFLAWKDDHGKFELHLQKLRFEKLCRKLLNMETSIADLQALPKGLATLLCKVNCLVSFLKRYIFWFLAMKGSLKKMLTIP